MQDLCQVQGVSSVATRCRCINHRSISPNAIDSLYNTYNGAIMKPRRRSRIAQQAFEWLGKMGIEVKPAIKTGEMYEFEYKDTLMFITEGTNDNELFLSAPIYLSGDSDERNREIYEIAESMTREELKDFIVEYVKGELSYVGQLYVRPSHIRKLRRYQLLQMLDDIVEIHNTFLYATMIAAAPIECWLNEEDLEKLENE